MVVPALLRRTGGSPIKDGVIVACVRAFNGTDEIARVDIAANVEAHYHAVRDAVMSIQGVNRVEIVSPGRRKVVYVLHREGESLFPVWKKEGSNA